MRISARIMNVAGGHATVGVWQDGGKAGELCVDKDVAQQFVESLNRIDEPTIKVDVDTNTEETIPRLIAVRG